MAVSLQKPVCAQDYVVRVATIADAKEIHEVVNKAFERDAFRNRPRATLERINGYFLDGQHTFLVIKVTENKITKIASLLLYSTDKAAETPTEGNIHMLSARPEFWGQKMSHTLLKKAEEWALKEKKDKIRLIVANTNQGLMKFYQNIGYKLTGEKFHLPEGVINPKFLKKNADGSNSIFAWHMEKELKLKAAL